MPLKTSTALVAQTSRLLLQRLTNNMRFIDIGVNLTDPVFNGIYRGKRKHDDDFDAILQRAQAAGVKNMIVTGGSLSESAEAIQIARKYGLYTTAGCHPTRSTEFDRDPDGPTAYLEKLDALIRENLTGKGRVVAVGECGLDYDRTHFASEEVQRTHFRSQLALAKKFSLPLFLHSRAAHADLVRILREEGFGNDENLSSPKGVVHSFTGTPEEADELMQMGFHVSVNGCSFKTAGNLVAAKAIRLDKLMIETDAPWCSMTSTQASKPHLDTLPPELRALYFPQATQPEKFVNGKAVKGRNEPCSIGGVAWVIHKLHDGVPIEEVAERIWKNTVELFKLDDIEQ